MLKLSYDTVSTPLFANKLFVNPPAELTTLAGLTSAGAAALAVKLPRILPALICCTLVNNTPVLPLVAVLSSTQPLVTVNVVELKLAKPLAACITAAVPVGLVALVPAIVMLSLLCAMAAVVLTLALSIDPALIAEVTAPEPVL